MLVEWFGTDGSQWDILGGPVRLSMGGASGLSMPEFDFFTQQTPAGDGQRLTGWRMKPRAVFLPFNFKDEANTDVTGVQREWWASWGAGEYGTLRVTDNLGKVRMLDIRFEDDTTLIYEMSPEVYSPPFGINAVADAPYWYGPVSEFHYSVGDEGAETFFGDGAGAPPFYIMQSQGGASSTITNEGDGAGWIELELQGQFTEFRVGIDGHYFGGQINVGAGDTLMVYTDPLKQYAMLNGTDLVTRQLTEVNFTPVPKGSTVPIDFQVVGVGRITARLTPRFNRAF